MSDTNAELVNLYEELKEHHRISMLVNDGSDDIEKLSQTEQDKWYDSGHKAMRKIAELPALNMNEFKMKAHATKMICELHGDLYRQNCNLEYAIREADTFEAVALSLARDFLICVA